MVMDHMHLVLGNIVLDYLFDEADEFLAATVEQGVAGANINAIFGALR
jgi:hypothetical protein